MLNKITKLICAGVIIELNGLCALGNRIDVFYEGGPTLVAEGIDGMELPQELSDPSHDLWDEYDPYVKFVGIRLNFPQELIADCEDKYWKIHDDALIQELEEAVSTEENFHVWCNEQESFDERNSREIQHFLHLHAHILKKASAKNYLITKDLCKQIDLEEIMYGIHLKGATLCLYGLEAKTPAEYYLGNLEGLIKYICRHK